MLKREKQQKMKNEADARKKIKLETDVELKLHAVWQDVYRVVLVDVF